MSKGRTAVAASVSPEDLVSYVTLCTFVKLPMLSLF